MMTRSGADVSTHAEEARVKPRLQPLAELYEQHSGSAFRLAYLLTGDAELAEDLVQDAFLKLIGRFSDLRNPRSFETYLKRTIVNLSYGTFRRKRIERAYLAHENTPKTLSEWDTPSVEARDELWMQLQRIAPRQRAALVLRYYEDLSELQTADALSCSVRTVKSLVTRGIEAMRAQQRSEQ